MERFFDIDFLAAVLLSFERLSNFPEDVSDGDAERLCAALECVCFVDRDSKLELVCFDDFSFDSKFVCLDFFLI